MEPPENIESASQELADLLRTLSSSLPEVVPLPPEEVRRLSHLSVSLVSLKLMDVFGTDQVLAVGTLLSHLHRLLYELGRKQGTEEAKALFRVGAG